MGCFPSTVCCVYYWWMMSINSRFAIGSWGFVMICRTFLSLVIGDDVLSMSFV